MSRVVTTEDHPVHTAARAVPAGRAGTSEKVAWSALFLAGDDASCEAGASLVIGGDWPAVLPGGS
jgi:hypothetical protein